MCLLKRVRPGNCTCEYSPYVNATISDPRLEKRRWLCGAVVQDAPVDFEIKTTAEKDSPQGLPHTMLQILPQVADKDKVSHAARRDAKVERVVSNKYWYYDVKNRMCLHDWHDNIRVPDLVQFKPPLGNATEGGE
eukprot:SM000051S17568  [mRNA]  locus=s51:477237:479376:+ [translate_table: standard]